MSDYIDCREQFGEKSRSCYKQGIDASQKNRAIKTYLLILLLLSIVMLTLSGCSNNTEQSENGSQTTQNEVQRGADYELLVWQAFWDGASEFFGVEYSAYKNWDTVTDYIQDFETSDGYTSHYYLIRTVFETTNAFGETIENQVTARCYYVPEYSNTVYVTYMTLNGETIHFDETTEDWLTAIGDGGTAPQKETDQSIESEKESGVILWSSFVESYNEIAAKDPDGNNYFLNVEVSANPIEHTFSNGEVLCVELTEGKYISRIEYIYPDKERVDQSIITKKNWVINAVVGAMLYELNGYMWTDPPYPKLEGILYELGFSDFFWEIHTDYLEGKTLTSYDMDNNIMYIRYLDVANEESHFIAYYSDVIS